MKVMKGGQYYCAVCGEQLFADLSSTPITLIHQVIDPNSWYRRISEGCPQLKTAGLLPIIELEDK